MRTMDTMKRNAKVGLIACIILLRVTVSFAQKTSNGNGAWNVPGTWTPTGVPGANDDVTIQTGHTITVPVNATCKKLFISGALDMSGADGITMDITNNSSAGPTNGIQLNSGGNFTIGPTNEVYFSSTQASGIVNNGGTLVCTGINGVNGGTIRVNACCGGEFRISGTASTTVYNIDFLQNANFNIASGGLLINGTISVRNNNWNGSSSTLSPIYGPASTLYVSWNGLGITSSGTSPLNNSLAKLWSVSSGTIGITPGYPNNVTLVNIGDSQRGINIPPNVNVGWAPGAIAVGLNGTLSLGDGTTPGLGSLDQVTGFSSGGILVDNNSILVGPSAAAPFINRGDFILRGTTKGIFYNYGATINFAGTGTSAKPQIISGTGSTVSFTKMIVSNGTYVRLQDPVTISGSLTFTSGFVGTNSSNSLTITNTATSAVAGGSATSFIDGPLKWNIPSTSSNNYLFPVGKGSTYLPLTLSPNTTSATTATVEAFNTGSGGSGDGVTVNSISNTEYWSVATTTDFTSGANVSISRPSVINPFNGLAAASSASGVYSAIGGAVSANTITGAGSIGITSPRFIAIGDLPLSARLVSSVAATCDGTLGSAVTAGSGGKPPYLSYHLVGKSPLTIDLTNSSGVFSNLPKGEYTITVTDAAATTASYDFKVLSPLLVSDNSCINQGNSTMITASNTLNTAATYTWSASPAATAGLNAADINKPNPLVSPTVNTVYTVTSSILDRSHNLILNGDFEDGYTGFSSDYPQFSVQPKYPIGEHGRYQILTDASLANSNFDAFDHTTGSGKMYFSDGPLPASSARAWYQTIAVAPNTTYTFIYWLRQAKANDVNPAKIQTNIDGLPITGSIATSQAISGPVWTEISYTFNSGPKTSLTISLVDISGDDIGNDFVIDDLFCNLYCPVTNQVTVNVGGCCPTGILSGGGTICDDGVATAIISVALTGKAPWKFTYAKDGVVQPPVTTSTANYTFTSGTGAHTYTLIDVDDALNTTCTGNVSGSAVVTVKPVPVVTSAATGSTCSNVALNYNITSDISTATFSWSRAAVTDISNLAVTGQSSDPITESLINTGISAVVVRYVITPIAAGCSGAAFNYDVTVNPFPVITSVGTGGPVCSGIAQNYDITSNLNTATFSWSRAAVTGISNAAISTSDSDPIIETLNSTSSDAVIVRYVIVPSADGCKGPSFNYEVTVSPVPTVTSLSSGSVCSGVAQNYTITSNINGASFTWDRASVGGVSNNAVTGQTSNTITETLINTGTSAVVVRYSIIPRVGSCSGASFNYDVTVNPAPLVNSATTGNVCSGVAQNYDITSNISSLSFHWTRASVADISNVATTSASDPITEVLTNTSSTPVVVRYVITPSGAGCAGIPFNYDVTVNPIPAITSPPNSTICSGLPLNYNITSNVNNATYSWNRAAVMNLSNPATSGSANPITETLNNTGLGSVVVKYVITPSASGCSGPPFDYNVTVLSAPNTSLIPAGNDVCEGSEGSVTIPDAENGVKYEAMIGGTSVSSITKGSGGNLVLSISSSSLVVGDNTITVYAYGCNDNPMVFNNTATIHVTATPIANAGQDIQVDNFSSITLDGSESDAGIYLWTSSDPGATIDSPASAITNVKPNSAHTSFTLTVKDPFNTACQSSDVVDVVVAPKPVVIPNVFSPNGDGIHDEFVIHNIEYFKGAILYMYNQWGELIFKSRPGYSEKWDGTRDGKDVTVGSYTYLLELNMDGYKSIAGTVTVIR